jgi:hypothetical protein
MVTISLWERSPHRTSYVGVIVPGPSGFTWRTWVGAETSTTVELEGVFVPLPYDQFFGLGGISHLWGWKLPLNETGADHIRELWAGFPRMACSLRAPEDDEVRAFAATHPKAALLAEAWVPLAVTDEARSEAHPFHLQLRGLEGQVVVLTWPNRNPTYPGQIAD